MGTGFCPSLLTSVHSVSFRASLFIKFNTSSFVEGEFTLPWLVPQLPLCMFLVHMHLRLELLRIQLLLPIMSLSCHPHLAL
jgi:hypothetical protein